MIFVTEGSQKSINLEILNKTLHCLNKEIKNKITICSSAQSVVKSLDEAFSKIQNNDILLTLPASKDDFEGFSGHTEYFRNKFSNKNLPMVFKGLRYNALLLTDHVSLKEVSQLITEELIVQKVTKTLEEYPKYFNNIKTVVFSGINPHGGEHGLMGNEEDLIVKSIIILQKRFPDTEFLGPLAGDTIHFQKESQDKLFVFAHHDQGLGIFKAQNKLFGINITLGLPFLRVSPDHGTAPDLQGKDTANFLGLYWLFNNIKNLI